MNMKVFLLTTVITGMFGFSAAAQTIVTETHTRTKPLNNVTQIPFSQFDVNNDGMYSMEEVGEALFYMFDTDGNQLIDNMEWNNENVMTIIPIEETQFQFIDTDNDGMTEMQINSYNEFYKRSGLMAFDENDGGLSAEEFIGEGYEVLDDNQDKLISLNEWQEVYLESRMEHNQPENYNDGE